jgi:hypothetical protein
MIMDERTEFADAVSVAAAASTALIGSQIDIGSIGIDLGESSDLWFVITVATEIITGGTAGTIQFKLASDSTAAIDTGGAATDHFASALFVTDDANANDDVLNAGGMPVKVKLPAGDYERFLGVLCVIGTTTVTAGAINAFLTPNAGKVKHYADASQ